MAGPREEHGSVPPPARKRRERHELDPESLWDKETDEAAEEVESDEEGGGEGDYWEEGGNEEPSYDDLDDWDHPVRRLKIN
jgi:hypothetical protein